MDWSISNWLHAQPTDSEIQADIWWDIVSSLRTLPDTVSVAPLNICLQQRDLSSPTTIKSTPCDWQPSAQAVSIEFGGEIEVITNADGESMLNPN